MLSILQPNHHYPATLWYHHIYQQVLTTAPSHHEAKTITSRLLAHYLPYTTKHHILDTPLQATSKQFAQLHNALKRLAQDEPLQYILGHALFLNHTLKINPNVLIPRSETEQMVAHIINEKHPCTNILDLCTGSGCIAIALKKAYPYAHVYALDVDHKALQVARDNAHSLQVAIHWLKGDLLHTPLPQKKWNLIVSNPPYIPLAEKNDLQNNILNHEPHQALFVPNHNPLIFYKRIAQLATEHLESRGYLYVELHENFSQYVADIFVEKGFKAVHLHRDLNNKNRWLSCHT